MLKNTMNDEIAIKKQGVLARNQKSQQRGRVWRK